MEMMGRFQVTALIDEGPGLIVAVVRMLGAVPSNFLLVKRSPLGITEHGVELRQTAQPRNVLVRLRRDLKGLYRHGRGD